MQRVSDAALPESLSPADLLTAGYDAFNRRDAAHLRGLMVDDFQWNEAEAVPGLKGCQSADEFGAYMEGFDRLWDEFTFEPLEMILSDGGAMVVRIRGRGRGKASGEVFELVIHHVWRFRDGRVARMDAFLDRREAAAAAELS